MHCLKWLAAHMDAGEVDALDELQASQSWWGHSHATLSPLWGGPFRFTKVQKCLGVAGEARPLARGWCA